VTVGGEHRFQLLERAVGLRHNQCEDAFGLRFGRRSVASASPCSFRAPGPLGGSRSTPPHQSAPPPDATCPLDDGTHTLAKIDRQKCYRARRPPSPAGGLNQPNLEIPDYSIRSWPALNAGSAKARAGWRAGNHRRHRDRCGQSQLVRGHGGDTPNASTLTPSTGGQLSTGMRDDA
jgi:hypothetical protein